MFLKLLDYLKDVKGLLEGDADLKKTGEDFLTAVSLSESTEAKSQICSFGIGFALSLLGLVLYNKERESRRVRILAKILGAPVSEMNRQFVLQKMKDDKYLKTIRQNILNVVETSSIDEFSKALDLPPGEALHLTPSEAWERQNYGSLLIQYAAYCI